MSYKCEGCGQILEYPQNHFCLVGVNSKLDEERQGLIRVARAAKEYRVQATTHSKHDVPLWHRNIHFELTEALKDVEHLL